MKHTPRQRLALENHCRFAFETINPKLAYMVPNGRILLTVATGFE